MLLKLCTFRRVLEILFILVVMNLSSGVGSGALAAQTTQGANANSRATTLGSSDPRNPEIQPDLSVERDPIPSPDAKPVPSTPAAPAASVTSVPNEVSGKGEAVQKGSDGIYTVRQDVNEVLLNCAVVDENGHTVEGLAQNDFRLWVDGVPQSISSFRQQDLPVSIGILIDNSSSMLDKRAVVNRAVMDLLRNSNREDTVFVVNFSDRAYLEQGFTTDLVALDRGLSHFNTRGTTALYDAIAASSDKLADDAKFQKQVLLVVSDGADNASRLARDQVIRRVQNLGGPVIYSIGLLFDSDPREFKKASEALQTLSTDTGGIAYFPKSMEEVNQIADQVAKDIREQYTIGFHAPKSNTPSSYHTTHVEVYSNKYGKLAVRTRHGYYLSSESAKQTRQASNH